MKHPILNIAVFAGLTLASTGSHTMFGQEAVQTTVTTTGAGTISEFGPQTIFLKTQDSPEPVRYTYSKTTTYVDEDGNPVSMETIKSGLPVTVYYVRSGDDLIASKVVVRKSVAVEPPPVVGVEEKKTTTTTTTTTNK
jgi:hypothetical protein